MAGLLPRSAGVALEDTRGVRTNLQVLVLVLGFQVHVLDNMELRCPDLLPGIVSRVLHALRSLIPLILDP